MGAWISAMANGLMTGRPFSPKTVNDYRRYGERYFSRHSTWNLKDIKKDLVAYPLEQFANKEHFVKAMLSLGKFLLCEGCIEEKDIQTLRGMMPKRHKPPKRITVNEEGLNMLIYACISPTDLAMVRLLAGTGLRAQEFCDLNWIDVNLTLGILTVQCGKGGKARRVGLTPTLAKAMQDYQKDLGKTSGPVFLDKNGKRLAPRGLQHRLNRIGRRAGVTVCPHALRRCFVTLNASKGRPLSMLQQACGHSRISTTERYCLITESETIAAMKQWD